MDLLSVAMDNLAIIRHQALRLGAGADVDDWVQEVLLHVWLLDRRGLTVDRHRNSRAFVLHCSQNRLLDMYRGSSYKRREDLWDYQDHSGGGPADAVSNLPNPEESVSEMEEQAQEKMRLAKVYEILPHVAGGQMLVEWSQGVKYDELSARYKLPLGTVKSRLNYAKSTVRRVLSGEGFLAADKRRMRRKRAATL